MRGLYVGANVPDVKGMLSPARMPIKPAMLSYSHPEPSRRS
jgi:hypothetical protein